MKNEIWIRRWFIFAGFGTEAIPYILDLPKEINEDEIALCIQEQIYNQKVRR